MKADVLLRNPQAGFTLIEVLAAMIILAVGLLSLGAMGIYGARSVTLAERQSEYTLAATRHLEAAVDSVDRLGTAIPCGVTTWSAGTGVDLVRRTISGSAGQRALLVEVVPDPESGAVRPQTYRLATSLYVPDAPAC